MAEKMTRRTFMKSAAAAAAAISLSGVLVGCGGGSAAADEVKLGAYTVKLYSANTHAEVQGTGGSSYKITAKADDRRRNPGGGNGQAQQCRGKAVYRTKGSNVPCAEYRPDARRLILNTDHIRRRSKRKVLPMEHLLFLSLCPAEKWHFRHIYPACKI